MFNLYRLLPPGVELHLQINYIGCYRSSVITLRFFQTSQLNITHLHIDDFWIKTFINL